VGVLVHLVQVAVVRVVVVVVVVVRRMMRVVVAVIVARIAVVAVGMPVIVRMLVGMRVAVLGAVRMPVQMLMAVDVAVPMAVVLIAHDLPLSVMRLPPMSPTSMRGAAGGGTPHRNRPESPKLAPAARISGRRGHLGSGQWQPAALRRHRPISSISTATVWRARPSAYRAGG
jgi:hypothetical protein